MTALTQQIKHHVGIRVARNRRHPIMRGVTRAARLWLEMDGNRNYDFDVNGERWLLERLASTAPQVVFDVGANVGDWTAEVLHAASEARVHSFELVPETAMRLSDRFRHNPRVTVVATGLSDEDATVPVKHYPGHTTVSGITDFPHPYDHEWLDAAVVRGDDYCAVHGIDHIDYLKIDAEGSDHRVLAGFEKMLKAGRIDEIQFEYGQANISARFLLADYHALLGDTGYVVGKLYPDHVEFRGYKLADEDFIGPNIVAVRSDRAELLALLS